MCNEPDEKIQSEHLSLRLAESSSYSDLHSSWLWVLFHLDDDFLHLRYNSVERDERVGAIHWPTGKLNSSNAFAKVFTFFHGQRVVWQACIAVRQGSKANDFVTLFHPCCRGPVDQHADFFFFEFAPKPTRAGDE